MKPKIDPSEKRKRIALSHAAEGSSRCEGYRRYGGMMTFGPVRWEQCKESATVMLTIKQEGKLQTLPACTACWNECIENGIEITKAAPVVNSQIRLRKK